MSSCYQDTAMEERLLAWQQEHVMGAAPLTGISPDGISISCCLSMRGALAFGVNFLVILVTGGVAFLYSYAVNSLQWETTGSLLFPVADFIFCGITIFMEVFTLAVYTVFYRECSSNPADELAMQENLITTGFRRQLLLIVC